MSVTGLLFLLSYAVGLLAAFAKHPRFGLYTYVAVFYLHPPIRWWGASLPDLRWSLVASIVTLLALLGSKVPPSAVPWTAHRLTKIVIVYVIWMWMQFPWANPQHFEGVLLLTKYVVLLYVIYRLVNDRESLVNFSLAHVIGCFYFGMLALGASGEGRLELLGGPGVKDSNTLGMHVSTGLFFAGSLLLSQRGWRRWGIALMVPAMANCLVQTESRGAFLGIACGGLVYYLSAPKAHRKLIVSLGALSLFVLAAYAPTTYWERMGTIKSNEETAQRDHSAESRLVLIEAQWQMFKAHPFGLGFDTTSYLSRDYLDTEWLTVRRGLDKATHGARASHNTLMSMLVDQGIPGILLALAAVATIIRMMLEFNRIPLRADNQELGVLRAAICSSLTAIFVSGMFTNYIKAEVQLWMLALLIAGLQIARDTTRQSGQAPVRPA